MKNQKHTKTSTSFININQQVTLLLIVISSTDYLSRIGYQVVQIL